MNQLRMGILSYHAIALPQAQWDPGWTTDSFRGSRWMTTFRKLPMHAPNAKIATGKNHGKAAENSASEAAFIPCRIGESRSTSARSVASRQRVDTVELYHAICSSGMARAPLYSHVEFPIFERRLQDRLKTERALSGCSHGAHGNFRASGPKRKRFRSLVHEHR